MENREQEILDMIAETENLIDSLQKGKNHANSITQDHVEQIETEQNVYIDAEKLQYNRDSRDAEYGWESIPSEWLISTRGSVNNG